MINKLQPNDISVVIQGPISQKATKNCLISIKKFLPGAEIILSTWENSNVDDLQNLYNIVIFSKDPGATVFDDNGNKCNNINRLIVSSSNGVLKATRKYILKIRSDLVLNNDNILSLYDDLEKRNQKFSLFKNRILSFQAYSIKYDRKKDTYQRMLFHISDWCYFGLKEDIQELFNIPSVEDEEYFSRYFEHNPKKANDIHIYRYWQMSPEAYITSQNAKKIIPHLNYNHYLDITEENIYFSENFIINNFRVFTQNEWGIRNQKKEYRHKLYKLNTHSPFDIYSELETKLDYQKYCNGEIKLNWYENFYIKNTKHIETQFKFLCDKKLKSQLNDDEQVKYKYFLSILKLNKHILNLFRKENKSIKNKFEQIFSIPFAAIPCLYHKRQFNAIN